MGRPECVCVNPSEHCPVHECAATDPELGHCVLGKVHPPGHLWEGAGGDLEEAFRAFVIVCPACTVEAG